MTVLDTENMIQNRQRIRFASIINISFVFIILAIQGYFSQPHASWLHLVHFLFQPLVLIVSMLDHIYTIQSAFYASTIILLIDLFIFMLNGIAISRCYNEPTAECFDRLWESSVWILLSALFSFVDLLNNFQLYNLIEQLRSREISEANPYQIMVINERKMSILHVYCLPQDIVFFFTTVARTNSLPIYWIGVIHVFIDPYVIWYGKTESKEIFAFRRILYVLFLVVDIILFIINLQLVDKYVIDWLCLFIVGSYVCIDVSLLVLVEETLKSFKSLKRL